MLSLVSDLEFLVVATIGMDFGVVLSRCRVIARPIPRDDGVTRTHAMIDVLIVICRSVTFG